MCGCNSKLWGQAFKTCVYIIRLIRSLTHIPEKVCRPTRESIHLYTHTHLKAETWAYHRHIKAANRSKHTQCVNKCVYYKVHNRASTKKLDNVDIWVEFYLPYAVYCFLVSCFTVFFVVKCRSSVRPFFISLSPDCLLILYTYSVGCYVFHYRSFSLDCSLVSHNCISTAVTFGAIVTFDLYRKTAAHTQKIFMYV